MTRSNHSDLHVDDIVADGDVARWTETIRQKRASRRRRKEEEEEDDRVVVGIKVDMHHVNWVTAYNMLTGIRFTVSRTNAKMDRPLEDADFDAQHKFSFDITGNELTPSAKYDFKFKDYAPLVFRHLRAKFKLDPADYLMSLTSKYILSELGSPGKSGSFFYFSRDYKYIIKTIHHSEHKLLRKILRDYHTHIESYPNTLISQFYGLHRVKIPYGRKIHFVVMNNLFPPHRDIHQTFDLKGSVIGRDYKEEDLERNPRATLKDLNWLRRNLHLELGQQKKHLFIQQMERDVALLQRLKIMDYSLLVGIHDLNRGNEEKLRDKTLQVFQPGAERVDEPHPNMLTRTPSMIENARNARELRQVIKREKPVPMDKSTSKMPEEMLEERKDFVFYNDDGGFRATHEDGRPGEEIYYLGIIDCLTHYGVVKKAEHVWKGLSKDKALISPIPPRDYGDRFIKFITRITKTREEAERELQWNDQLDGSIHTRTSSHYLPRASAERTTDKAEKQARKPEQAGPPEANVPEKFLSTVRSPSVERTNGLAGATLPVVEEAGESGSTGGRSGRSRDEGGKPNDSTDTNHDYPAAVSDPQRDDAVRYTKLPPGMPPPPRLADSPLPVDP
ncbi:phosphatidylinositol-4-phosphate 5-kinase its3 [Lasallia pustulata]|uniref:1-phosphatidylinositol-4-phosphate 5-kinase n=1 Tax=Lasallia pustulata TaxID=136370 RepID=A0A1W5D1U7_9LECA|nr:phosphatidylinositol-4-phosphate 5-kinase its3 [Lasallia pustulata]